jgi:hypothetical protein
VLAMIYPEPAKGGKSPVETFNRAGVDKSQLSDARAILRYSDGIAQAALSFVQARRLTPRSRSRAPMHPTSPRWLPMSGRPLGVCSRPDKRCDPDR